MIAFRKNRFARSLNKLINKFILNISKEFKILLRTFGVSLIFLTFQSCGNENNFTYRYRMIVYYKTAEGARSASAVREMTFQEQPVGPFGNTNVHISVRGQAVIMPVAHKRIYAILKWQPDKVLDLPEPGDFAHESVVKALLGPQADGIISYEKVKNSLDRTSRPRSIFLDRRYWPIFVRFEDEKDPRSVSSCETADIRKACGVKVLGIVIEESNSSISNEIINYLPWTNKSEHQTLSGDKGIFRSDIANLLDVNSFLMEH